MATVVGSDITMLKAKARQTVMDYFVKIACLDGRDATQRAMDTRKAGEARQVVNGGASQLLEQEARMRNVPVLELASLVLRMAGEADAIELSRVKVSLLVDAATTHRQVLAVMREFEIPFL